MSNKLKTVGSWLRGVGGFSLILAGAAFGFLGFELMSEILLPWFNLASILAFTFVLFVVLPLSVFRRCRRFAAVASLVSTFVFGATLWMGALLATFTLWGKWAVWIGLFMMGVGVVPIAILATLFKGMWSNLGLLVVLTVLTFGTGFYASWIGEKADASEET